jgi:transposase
MNEALAEFDDAIASVVAEHPDARIFASFPGVGPILTGVLLEEIGEDRNRYPTVQTLLAEAGLAPVTRNSGRSRSVRFRYAANTRLRAAACPATDGDLEVDPADFHCQPPARRRYRHILDPRMAKDRHGGRWSSGEE